MEILEQILSDKSNRKQLIKEFQKQVWHNEDLGNEILSELAYDLDFYEPDSTLRAEDASYYGDDKLEQEIKSVLKKLKGYSNQ
jgi:hypothetical protein